MSSMLGQPATGKDAFERAQLVKRAHAADLMNKANVIGLGVGLRQRAGTQTDEVALIVLVSAKQHPASLDPEDRIPSELDGVPVDVQEIGEPKAG